MCISNLNVYRANIDTIDYAPKTDNGGYFTSADNRIMAFALERVKENRQGMLVRVFARELVRASAFYIIVATVVFWASESGSAQYAAMVMDARDGKVLYSSSAETKLHPASLTKMMTLYIAFEAVENGEITLDTKVKISRFAASEPPSRIGLRPSSRISLRYLIRAAAVRSANDAATAIAEAISGSEQAFSNRMNRTARAMGMNRTHFKNAHGLTQKGHVSTARDMTILARHIIYDYPDYYNLFSRKSTDAGIATVRNTNQRFLTSYTGADGIKTGYTNAAGFNLVASARRGNKRIITTVFGGRSVNTRNNHVAELMDNGFKMARANVKTRRPNTPEYGIGEVVRSTTNFARVPKPRRRPGFTSINPDYIAYTIAQQVASAELETVMEGVGDAVEVNETFEIGVSRPIPHPKHISFANSGLDGVLSAGIFVGKFPTRQSAQQHLLKSTLVDFSSLGEASKSIELRGGAYVAKLVGLSKANARKACVRLTARKMECKIVYIQ